MPTQFDGGQGVGYLPCKPEIALSHTNDRIRSIVPPSSCFTTRHLVSDDKEVHIAKVGHMDYTSGDVHSDVANAERLAACWNACVGIPTEHLQPYQDDRSLANRISDLEQALQRLLDAPKLGTNDGMRRAREHAERVLRHGFDAGVARPLHVEVTLTGYDEARGLVSFEFYDATKGRVQREIEASLLPIMTRRVGQDPSELLGKSFTASLAA